MKNSIRKLIPSWVTSVPSFLTWIQEDFGVSTSGLKLGWTWVFWFRFMLGYLIGQSAKDYVYLPRAFWWPQENVECSHNARPWAPVADYDEIPF